MTSAGSGSETWLAGIEAGSEAGASADAGPAAVPVRAGTGPATVRLDRRYFGLVDPWPVRP